MLLLPFLLNATKKDEGRITVEWDKGDLTKEQLKQIEDYANQNRRNNLDVMVTLMDRYAHLRCVNENYGCFQQ